MHNSRLIRMIGLLSPDEVKQVEKFLKSPFFNTNEQVAKLFQYIIRCAPSFDQPRLSKEKVYQKLYPGKVYKDEHMRKLMSRLLQLLERFWAVQELEDNKGLEKQLLLKRYAKKGDYDIFRLETEKRLTELKKQKKRDTDFYGEALRLNHELYFHPNTPKIKNATENIDEAMDDLDLFFTLSKLRYASELLTREHVLSEEHNFRFLDEVIQIGASELGDLNPLIPFYMKLIELQREGLNLELFDQCVSLFRDQAPLMDRFDKSSVFGTLINRALTGVNEGEEKYIGPLVQLYKMAIKHKLLLEEGKIAYNTFINVAVMGAAAGELIWTGRFIDIYQRYLEEQHKETATGLAWAYWHYQRGNEMQNEADYKQSIRYLNKIRHPSEAIKLRKRSLLLRVYYDYHFLMKKDEIKLLDHLSAFEKSVQRNKTLAENRLNSYQNLMKITKKLMQLKTEGQKGEAIEKLRLEIENTPRIPLKHWLLKKVEELG